MLFGGVKSRRVLRSIGPGEQEALVGLFIPHRYSAVLAYDGDDPMYTVQ